MVVEGGVALCDGVATAGTRRACCRRVPEERTVVARVSSSMSATSEEFTRLVCLLCSGVLVAWSEALLVVLCYSSQ